MNALRTALVCLPLGAPLPGQAQATELPAPPAPPFYVGLAACVSPFQQLGSRAETGFPVPLQATLGYQLRPRLAVQASLAYRGGTYSYDYTGRDYAGGSRAGVLYLVSATNRTRALSAAVLTRLTLTRRATHRVQVDMLAGLTLESQHYRWHTVRTDSAAAPVAASYGRHPAVLFVTAGPGVRCCLGSHLVAFYQLLFSAGLADFDSSSGFYYRRNGSMALGLQYCLGRR